MTKHLLTIAVRLALLSFTLWVIFAALADPTFPCPECGKRMSRGARITDGRHASQVWTCSCGLTLLEPDYGPDHQETAVEGHRCQ